MEVSIDSAPPPSNPLRILSILSSDKIPNPTISLCVHCLHPNPCFQCLISGVQGQSSKWTPCLFLGPFPVYSSHGSHRELLKTN